MTRAFFSDMRVGVVGAGLIGLACARALLAEGARVTLYERARAGEGAGWAAAGMLAVAAETLEEGRCDAGALALGRESLALWPAFAADVARQAARDIDFRQHGSILVALDAADERRLRTWAERVGTLGLACEPLEGTAIGAREPGLTAEARFAVVAREDWSVDARALTAALAVAVRAAGGAIKEGVEVVDVVPGAPVRIVSRAAGIAGEDRLDAAVLAPGWRAAALAAQLPELAGVHPVKGQMLAVDAGSAAPRHVVRGQGAYVVPRTGGRVLVGATSEPGATDLSVDPAAIERLRAAAIALLPALAGAPTVETWSGVRPGRRAPGREGEGPLVDRIAPGVVAAVGHYRNGVLLAPVTAARVVALLRGG